MSLAVVRSRALVGMTAPPVSVEVHVGNGLPAFHVVGLPEAEVRESRERVRAALLHAGFDFPNRRLTVNLAPADLPKDSGRFDLPIALGILAASGQLPACALERIEFVGELSLSGSIRPIRGALAMAAAVARDPEASSLMLPTANGAEAALVDGLRTLSARSLPEVVAQLRGELPVERIERAAPAECPAPVGGHRTATGPDFAEVKGHRAAKRALEVAAAGRHSMLMLGPPGSGKSLLATRLPSILPPMSDDEALEAAAVASLAGRFAPESWGRRPFRAPHHSASTAALVGGGANPRPGEISLAHLGVLFLDELPEFGRGALEALREPLETGRIALSRAARQVELPADFQLVSAMNPCPCGYLGHRLRPCRCTPPALQRYRSRLSGPLLDRLDLQVEVPALDPKELRGEADAGGSTAELAAQVQVARSRQLTRRRQQQGLPNARLQDRVLLQACAATELALSALDDVLRRHHHSGRARVRLLRIARTLADLDDRDQVEDGDVLEAAALRESASINLVRNGN